MLFWVLALVAHAQFEKKLRSQMRDSTKTFKDSGIFEEFGMGSLGDAKAYLQPYELENLMKTLVAQFPEAIRPISIGKTSEGRTIPAYMLALYQRDSTWEQIASERPAMLITGLHHAREMTSFS